MSYYYSVIYFIKLHKQELIKTIFTALAERENRHYKKERARPKKKPYVF